MSAAPETPLSTDSKGLTAIGPDEVPADEGHDWTVIFAGDSLSDWDVGVFGEGDEYDFTDDGAVLPIGVPMSGIRYAGEPPSVPFELRVEATKKHGDDFFLGVTLPVGDAHATVLLGGWGGSLCGLSSIDGKDASTNETKTYRNFPNGKRQTLLIRVTEERVVASVNGETFVDVGVRGRSITTRPEVAPCVPLGVASFATSTILHCVEFRALERTPR